jgi:hypothetical protein
MPVRLSGSTSGYTELTAPAVAGNNTITFPATSGTAVVNGANSAIVSGTAVASTSGTSIDFTGIPSWVKRVTVMFNGVSTSGTSSLRIQIGSGSIDSTGYSSSYGNIGAASVSGGINSTSGWEFLTIGASSTNSGIATICLLGSNIWTFSLLMSAVTSTNTLLAAGVKTALSGTLDRVRITTVNGTDTFDAGSINIMYE